MIKTYQLLKDLPTIEAGTIFVPFEVSFELMGEDGKQKDIQFYAPKGKSYPLFSQREMYNPEWFKGITEFPKDITDIDGIDGYVIDNGVPVYVKNNGEYNIHPSHIYATEAYAKSAIAFAHLSQIAKVMNNGWERKPGDYYFYVSATYDPDKLILRRDNKNFGALIKFKTMELAELSINHHTQLWKDYLMLK